MENQLNQEKKLFVKSCTVLNHDPIILVERPPSPENIRKVAKIAMSYDEDESAILERDKPRYMRQLRHKVRTPSLLTTIDAFTVKTKKKRNIWDNVLDEMKPMQFQSTVRPYSKLTERERTDLEAGWSFHKPRLEAAEDLDEEQKALVCVQKKKKGKHAKSAQPKMTVEKIIQKGQDSGADSDTDTDELTPFITQMAKIRSHSSTVKGSDNAIDINKIRREKTEDETSKAVRFAVTPTSVKTKRKSRSSATKVVL
ncbi:hypothetical protein KUTeg_009141 [Tegillarca granosa]|uniref:Uncharacterized protein n=1 Tax=Tegillarca granosa TaxID=220873 RepID=A0ABQ9F7L5_TEGGR|nr:hypothetical protein KUTeg_009141 [Tegillarca granosa]